MKKKYTVLIQRKTAKIGELSSQKAGSAMIYKHFPALILCRLVGHPIMRVQHEVEP
jgi:hypothetical protein